MDVTRGTVLSLYRMLFRYGKNLKYTDKEYYLKRLRKEFNGNRNLQDQSEIEHCIEKGNVFLKKNVMI
ncbi:hypothetical protein SNE40_023224 [Patella caerulea]|uniref:Complex 1 LYR protein domain-containing protein n=1 Tax=Patella caerulea TaxID=87958 RepID=A0AAN8FY19_PATCE